MVGASIFLTDLQFVCTILHHTLTFKHLSHHLLDTYNSIVCGAGAIQVSPPARQGTKAETSVRSTVAWALKFLAAQSSTYYFSVQTVHSNSCLVFKEVNNNQAAWPLSILSSDIRLAAIRHFTTGVWQVLWSPICGRPCWPWAAIWPNWTRWELSKSWLDEKMPLVSAHVLVMNYELITNDIQWSFWLDQRAYGGFTRSTWQPD